MSHEIDIDFRCNKEASMSEFDTSQPRCIANYDVTVMVALKTVLAAVLLRPRSMWNSRDILGVPIDSQSSHFPQFFCELMTILQNVKDQMEVMKEKDALIQTRNRNHQLLLEKLDNLVVSNACWVKQNVVLSKVYWY